ncbi:MAG: Stp1/IreP family PP2C-type Ser/Thr phosphatase, partial [Anaerolineales bacterium]|nr:Stp1/IreP family PP2C-type Ser/Thr phosphatase [Anaerolineales bacterium]
PLPLALPPVYRYSFRMGKLAPIVASLRTDIGRVHDHNEDFITCWEPKTPEDEKKHGWLYIVADGVGGAEAGEVASQFASEKVMAYYLANDAEAHRGERLRQAMQQANTELRQMVANEPESRRMATTMVTAVLEPNHVHIANVGDSRAYHWRAGAIQQITKDHSLVAKLVEEGAISASEAENHPYGNIILYSIGSDKNPRIDLFDLPLAPGDAIILCSDGLTKHVPDAEIGELIARHEPAVATETLINLANERGGRDNISVAVLRYGRRPAVAAARGAQTAVSPTTGPNQLALILYTLLLSFVQTCLIILVWLWLRV